MVSMSGRFYSCSTSTTSRPLYWPQWGQTRCGSLGSWQFGHSDRPEAFSASWARRVAVRLAECLRFGFGISQTSDKFATHLLDLQVPQRPPAIVSTLEVAIAFGLVPVPAADGTDPFADLTANPLHRQGQHHLFAEHILQLQAAAFIKPNFGFAFVD